MTRREAQIDAVRAALRAVSTRAANLAAGATDSTWTKRPPSGGWSAAECLAHLTLTNEAYLPLLEQAYASVPAGAPLPSRYARGFGGAMLEWVLEPPSRMKSKTIAAFVPTAEQPKDASVAAFTRTQEQLLAWLKRAEQAPLNRMLLASPFNARLRYNAYAALRVLAAHGRRHLWQAERALRGMP